MGDDIYAQALDSQGTIQWQSNGVPVAAGSGSQKNPIIASDGDHGAVIAYDQSTIADEADVLASRVFSNGEVGGVTAVAQRSLQPPILRCMPNPATSSVAFVIAEGAYSDKVVVRDVAGRTVATLPVAKKVEWDLKDRQGKRVAPGLYFVELVGNEARRVEMLIVAH